MDLGRTRHAAKDDTEILDAGQLDQLKAYKEAVDLDLAEGLYLGRTSRVGVIAHLFCQKIRIPMHYLQRI